MKKHEIQNKIKTTYQNIKKVYNIFIKLINELSRPSTLSEDELKSLYLKSRTRKLTSNYIVFDLETTGLDIQKDKIIEISAIKYVNNEQVDVFTSLINPKVNINGKITSITGITNRELKKQKTAQEVIPTFINFIEDYTLIAHNASFDFKILMSECYRNKIDLPKNKVIDTLSLSKKCFTQNQVKNYKLETFKKYFNLDVGSHRALDDCITCAELYKHCALREALKVK